MAFLGKRSPRKRVLPPHTPGVTEWLQLDCSSGPTKPDMFLPLQAAQPHCSWSCLLALAAAVPAGSSWLASSEAPAGCSQLPAPCQAAGIRFQCPVKQSSSWVWFVPMSGSLWGCQKSPCPGSRSSPSPKARLQGHRAMEWLGWSRAQLTEPWNGWAGRDLRAHPMFRKASYQPRPHPSWPSTPQGGHILSLPGQPAPVPQVPCELLVPLCWCSGGAVPWIFLLFPLPL